MAAATNATLGEIKLAGDLAGSNDGEAPELTATGVTAGEYLFPIISVDGKGRIVAAESATTEDILDLLPVATDSSLGICKPDGTTITAVDGVLSVLEENLDISSLLPVATDSSLGICKPDGTTITAVDGVLSVPVATDSSIGISKPDGTTITVNDGTLSVPVATSSVRGVSRPDGTTILINDGVLSVNTTLVPLLDQPVNFMARQTYESYLVNATPGTTINLTGQESNVYRFNVGGGSGTDDCTVNFVDLGSHAAEYFFVLRWTKTMDVIIQVDGVEVDAISPPSGPSILSKRYVWDGTELFPIE